MNILSRISQSVVQWQQDRKLHPRARQWVRALESGEYQQGTAYLRGSDTQFCCLGVACDLYAQETGQGKWEKITDHWHFEPVPGLRNVSTLPYVVSEWFGLNSTAGEYDRSLEHGSPVSLAGLNDEGGTFKDIAAVIRSQPKGLFKNGKVK